MKVGFIGVGLMGEPMVLRLVEKGRSLIIYNRTKSKLEALKNLGVEVAESPEAVIKAANCIILILSNSTAIRETILSENSVKELVGKTIIQMSTISPTESKEIQKLVTEAGGDYLEAPVLGSIPEAKEGKLVVMVGATQEQFQQWFELLKTFGSEPLHIGTVGSASALKLALNQFIVSLTGAFALSLGYIQKQGVDVENFMQILRKSALYAPTFDKKLQRMLDRNYDEPNFPTKHLLKDANLFINEAKAENLNVSSLEGMQQILELTQELGFSEADYSALFSAISPQE